MTPLGVLPGMVEMRPIDGIANNQANPALGSAGMPLVRLVPAAYDDGVSNMAGAGRPDPRTVSNALGAQTASTPDPNGLSGFFWAFGQLLDHDLNLTHTNPAEFVPIPIQPGDPLFGSASMVPFSRSETVVGTGTSAANPRQQPNAITAFIDASFVYGSDAGTAAMLRADDGSGRLLTAAGGLLPTNGQLGLDADPANDGLRVAGDTRVNENAALTSLQTVFLREHNRLADAIQAEHSGISGDDTYRAAREIVAGQMQAIAYNEFLPILLGETGGLGTYGGYDASENPGIANEFSAALFRFGHSLVQDEFVLVNPDRSTTTVPVSACFFNPACVASSFDVESVLAGLGLQAAQQLDARVVDSLRNMLLTDFGTVGIDLLSINLQRGRDHGLPDYLALRAALGLGPTALSPELTALYGGNDIDLLVAAFMEAPFGDALVGETTHAVLYDQFHRLRSGDRFWYQNQDLNNDGMADDPLFDAGLVDWLNRQTLGEVIRRNTGIDRVNGSVFFLENAAILASSVPAPAPLALLAVGLVAACGLPARRRDRPQSRLTRPI